MLRQGMRMPALTVLALLASATAAAAQQNPAANEQLLIYELNRARNNPPRYAAENGLGSLLDSVAASPPLAVNARLVQSSGFHAEEMAAFDYFGHQSQVTGDWPNQMALDAGYTHPFSPTTNSIESLAAGYGDVLVALRALIQDAGTVPPGHRYHLLATGPSASFWLSHREIGTGYAFDAASTYQRYYAIHTAYVNTSDRFLTGVVYNDSNGNGRYDLGEGLSGVTVSIGGTSVLSNPAGGWSIPVVASGYTVTASGGTFVGTGTATVTVSGSNVEVDFESGSAAGEVDFANQPGGPIAAPTGLAATAVSGTRIDLAWTDASTNETGFLVERRSGAGAYAQIAALPAGTAAHSDTTAAELTTYFYRVRATDGSAFSPYSNEASATTPFTDSDGDGLPDTWETGFFGDLTRGAGGDEEPDGLTNLAEYLAGTDPTLADTDGDGMTDGAETGFGFNPLNGDQDLNGTPDGQDDWDADTIPNASDPSPGSLPTPPKSDDDDKSNCGLTGLELLIPCALLWIRRRSRKAPRPPPSP